MTNALVLSSGFPIGHNLNTFSSIQPKKHRSFLALHLEKKNILSYPCDACSIRDKHSTQALHNFGSKILYASCFLQCVLFLLRLLSCSTPRTEFSCITAPVTYVATYWSNPMRFSLSHCPVEMRGTLFRLIIVSSLPFASESCIIVANMDDKSFLQTSPNVYYNTIPTSLLLSSESIIL